MPSARFPLRTHWPRVPSSRTSPWPWRINGARLLWSVAWPLLCGWTPSPLNRWRLFWLRRFGAKINGRPYVHARTRITFPWNLTLHDRACLGDGTHAYCLGRVEIGAGSTVAQEAYLCTGTHLLTDPFRPVQTAPIVIEAGAFIGARAFILPGVRIGAGAVIGACAVVARNVRPGTTMVGNPARAVETDAPAYAASANLVSLA